MVPVSLLLISLVFGGYEVVNEFPGQALLDEVFD